MPSTTGRSALRIASALSVTRSIVSVQSLDGKSRIAYCDAADFRPILSKPGTAAVGEQGTTADVDGLLARVSPEEAGECGLAGITSAPFVVRAGGEILAAAGYEEWPEGTAHLCVLTHPAARGRGLARIAAAGAVADAIAAGLLPQWRARPEASRRVARALGFRELGTQLSLTLDGPPAA